MKLLLLKRIDKNEYLVKVGNREAVATKEFIEKQEVENPFYFKRLQERKPKYCFYCEEELWGYEFEDYIICPKCKKETCLWESIEKIHRQKKFITKLEEDYKRAKQKDFRKIKPKRGGKRESNTTNSRLNQHT